VRAQCRPAEAQQTAQGLGGDCGVACLKQGWEQALWEVVPVSLLTSAPVQLPTLILE